MADYMTVYKDNHSVYQIVGLVYCQMVFPTGDCSVNSIVVAMTYMLTQAALAEVVPVLRAEHSFVCVCGLVGDKLLCLTASHIAT